MAADEAAEIIRTESSWLLRRLVRLGVDIETWVSTPTDASLGVMPLLYAEHRRWDILHSILDREFGPEQYELEEQDDSTS